MVSRPSPLQWSIRPHFIPAVRLRINQTNVLSAMRLYRTNRSLPFKLSSC